MAITRDDLDLLFTSELPDPVLLLLEGRSQVVDGSVLRRPAYARAMLVGTREDLACELSGGEGELEEAAVRLDMKVSRWGR